MGEAFAQLRKCGRGLDLINKPAQWQLGRAQTALLFNLWGSIRASR